MSERKRQTFIFEGLGFPIKLIHCPMKKVFGQWVLDIDIAALQQDMAKELIYKPVPLTGAELRFIRKFLGLTTTEFGKLVGVSHVAVLKWEKEEVNINPATEVYIRLHVLRNEDTKDNEFRQLYDQISIDHLVKNQDKRDIPLAIDCSLALA